LNKYSIFSPVFAEVSKNNNPFFKAKFSPSFVCITLFSSKSFLFPIKIVGKTFELLNFISFNHFTHEANELFFVKSYTKTIQVDILKYGLIIGRKAFSPVASHI